MEDVQMEEKENLHRERSSEFNSLFEDEEIDEEALYDHQKIKDIEISKKVVNDTTYSEEKKGLENEMSSNVYDDYNLIFQTFPLKPKPDDEPNSRTVYIKWPSYMKVVHEPFDPKTFDPKEAVSFEGEDEEAASARLSSTLRWKYEKDKEEETSKIASNAHFIQWSNGLWSLSIGDEIYDLITHGTEDENIFLYSQHSRTNFMEELVRVKERIVVKPPSDGRKKTPMPKSFVDSKVKMTVTSKDPETEKSEEEKIALEKIKLKKKIEMKNKALTQSRFNKVYNSNSIRLTKDFIEADDDDENDRGVGETYKKSRKSSKKSRNGYVEVSDEEEEEEEEDEDNDFLDDDDEKEEEESKSESESEEEAEETDEEENTKRGPKSKEATKPASELPPSVKPRKTAASIFDSDSS